MSNFTRRDILKLTTAGTAALALPATLTADPGAGALTREQGAATEFLTASEFMRRIADDKHGKGLLEFTNNLIVAMVAFGSSELYARQSERCEVLEMPAGRARTASQLSARYNNKGLALLGRARDALNVFRQELAGFPDDAVAAKEFETMHEDLREALVDLEVKASDVEKIEKTIRTCLDEVRTKGKVVLPDYLGRHLDELEKLRKREDRGAVENIPVWKIALIALAVGVWVWAYFRCRWWGDCSYAPAIAYFAIAWFAVLIRRFC